MLKPSTAATTGRIPLGKLGGRQVIPFVFGTQQSALLSDQHGETDLVYRDGNFYLISEQLVASAQGTCHAIALEDLQGFGSGSRLVALSGPRCMLGRSSSSGPT